jgi:hypothetical protein
MTTANKLTAAQRDSFSAWMRSVLRCWKYSGWVAIPDEDDPRVSSLRKFPLLPENLASGSRHGDELARL